MLHSDRATCPDCMVCTCCRPDSPCIFLAYRQCTVHRWVQTSRGCMCSRSAFRSPETRLFRQGMVYMYPQWRHRPLRNICQHRSRCSRQAWTLLSFCTCQPRTGCIGPRLRLRTQRYRRTRSVYYRQSSPRPQGIVCRCSFQFLAGMNHFRTTRTRTNLLSGTFQAHTRCMFRRCWFLSNTPGCTNNRIAVCFFVVISSLRGTFGTYW